MSDPGTIHDRGGESDQREHLTEEEAARLWSRAAELQAEADRRAELPPPAEDDDAPAEGPTAATGYELRHVLAAATEAGIEAEYLTTALADLRAERAIEAIGSRRPWRIAHALLGRPAAAVAARRIVHAHAGAVLAAMEQLMPSEPYGLVLSDRIGDPARGGVLVFDIPGAGFSSAGQGGFVGAASWADLRQVIGTVTEREDETPSCEVILRAPVAWAVNLNASICGVFAGAGSGLGGLGGAAIASALGTILTGGLAGALTVAAVAGGALAGGSAMVKLYRSIYRYALGRGRTALEGLLASVAARAEGGWGFTGHGGTAARPSAEEGT